MERREKSGERMTRVVSVTSFKSRGSGKKKHLFRKPGVIDKPQCELTFEIRHREPVAVDPRRVDVRVKGPEGRRAYVVETLQQEG